MNWLTPSLVANLCGGVVLFCLYAYLWVTERQRYLRTWTICWGLYVVRFALGLASAGGHSTVPLRCGYELAALCSGALLFAGSRQFVERPWRRWWNVVIGGLAAWIVVATLADWPVAVSALPVFWVVGLVYIYTGSMLLHHLEPELASRYIVGSAFVIWGLHKINYPFVRPVPWLAPYGYLVAAALELTAAIGILVVYFERARLRLARSEQRFRALVGNVPGVVFRCQPNPPWRAEYVSNSARMLTGWPAGDYLGSRGRLLLEDILPEDLPLVAGIPEQIRRRQPIEVEFRVRHRDGGIRWLHLRGAACAGSDGTVTAIDGMIFDITAHRDAEEELRVKDRALAASLNAVILADTERRITYANAAALRLWGYDHADEVLGRPVADFCADQERAEAALSELCREGSWAGGMTGRRRDGSTMWLEASATKVTDPAGGHWCLMASFVDQTARRRAEEERAKLEEQLRQAQKMEAVGQLAGGIAHDFNNLLQVIAGYTDMALLELSDDHRAAGDLRQVAAAAERARRLVEQLLLFSRRHPTRRTTVDLNEVVLKADGLTGRLLGEHIEVTSRTCEWPLWVIADAYQLELLLLNLSLNARDAMPSGGQLTITADQRELTDDYCAEHLGAQPGPYACLEVTDTGVGMTPEQQERAFEPFFTTKEVGKGTGLGLATVYGIVQEHDGLIETDSELGRGTAVRVLLPLGRTAPDQPPAGDRAGAVSAGQGQRILLAEDDAIVRELGRRLLEQAGYRVEVACDGQEAVELHAAGRGEIDLVVLDAVMPRRSGPSAFEAIRAADPEVPVLFVTGYGYHATELSRLNGQLPPVLTKPYPAPVLLAHVAAALGRDEPAPPPAKPLSPA